MPSKLATFCEEPTGTVLGRERSQAPSQLQRRFHARRLGVADTAHPCQLFYVETKQPPQPTVVGQQPLRDVGHRLTPNAGTRDR